MRHSPCMVSPSGREVGRLTCDCECLMTVTLDLICPEVSGLSWTEKKKTRLEKTNVQVAGH